MCGGGWFSKTETKSTKGHSFDYDLTVEDLI